VAIIMDGNGRWAERRGLSRNEGHNAGLESVKEAVRAAHELGIKVLTLYAFSSENWNRPRSEVEALMSLLDRYIDEQVEEVDRNGIQIRIMGRLEDVPRGIRDKLLSAVERTRTNDEMILCFALSYGGRQELVDAARKLVRAAEEGKIAADAVDEKTFAACLYQPDLPDPDLLVRTGAESRVSNFLLWQIAYAEIHTSDVMWPEFRKDHLVGAILDYQGRERRFGLTSAQVRSGRAEEA
jgi:undecaprenyl diphosphate synthase